MTSKTMWWERQINLSQKYCTETGRFCDWKRRYDPFDMLIAHAKELFYTVWLYMYIVTFAKTAVLNFLKM